MIPTIGFMKSPRLGFVGFRAACLLPRFCQAVVPCLQAMDPMLLQQEKAKALAIDVFCCFVVWTACHLSAEMSPAGSAAGAAAARGKR